MQPIQQQGRRFPSASSVIVRLTWFFLVSAVLTDIVQQIHSLRARGVIFSHASKAFGEATKTFCKSVGSLWATPPATSFWVGGHLLNSYTFTNVAAPIFI